MENKEPNVKRNKKNDKAKRNFDLHGTNSSKHVRKMEALLEMRKETRMPPKK